VINFGALSDREVFTSYQMFLRFSIWEGGTKCQ
jgi:hypothetical protein